MGQLHRCASTVLRDERGATAIEYALLAALIAAGLIAIVATLGDSVAGGFQAFNDEFEAAR